MKLYVDTSALTKLLKRENETAALRTFLTDSRAELLSSALVITELGRVGLAYGLPAASIATVLQQLDTIRVTDDILGAAGRLTAAPGRVLRALDAIHVASALTIGYDTVLTYDKPMTDAAAHHGLTVVAPR